MPCTGTHGARAVLTTTIGSMTEPVPAPAPAPAPQPVASAASDGKTLGIVALVVAFFFQLLGLILAIVAKVQSNRAGVKNTPATVAIIVSIVLMVLGIIIAVAIVVPLLTQCATYGPGVHTLDNGLTLTCG